MKKYLLTILILASAFIPSFAHADITSNLQGWWKLDEGTGSTTADSSGNSNTGTLTNNADWTSLSNIGSFAETQSSAASALGGYVISANNVGGSHQDMTMAEWIYPTAFNFMTNQIVPLSATSYYFRIVNPGNHFFFKDRLGTDHDSGVAISLNTWTHLAVTCKDSTGQVTMYINGSQVLQDTLNVNDCFNNTTAKVDIGGYNGSVGNFSFTGRIGQTRLYYRVLTSTDIAELYAYPPVVGGSADYSNLFFQLF